MTDLEKEKTYFKAICSQRLAQYNLITLRNYGRHLNIPNPTCLKKSDLIKEISSVLCAKKNPKRNTRGAPAKYNVLQSKIVFEIEDLKQQLIPTNDTAPKKSDLKTCDNLSKSHKEPAVRLQFFVTVDQLNEQQKQLLTNFLNSL